MLPETEYLSKCIQKNRTPFTIEAFGRGREHGSFEVFFRFFVPTVVAKNKFKNRLLAPMHSDQDICTVSDEACTLLLLENNYDRWTDVHKNKLAATRTMDPSLLNRDEKRKRKWESDVSPKYTEGGIVYSDMRKISHKGWKEEGIRRFNSICVLVKQDRKDHPGVLTSLVHKWKASMHQPKQTNDEIIDGTGAYHELWDDEPEQSTLNMPEGQI